MPVPEMIIFDYGQTLINEKLFDGVKGTKAVLEQCAAQPVRVSARTIQQLADEISSEIGHYAGATHSDILFEVHNHKFQNYLYQYFDVEITQGPDIVEQVFWDNASDFKPTEGISELLAFLESENIRLAIISNISFSGQTLTRRVRQWFPETGFEFILASSEYVFRKPHPRIFDFALRKAGLAAEKVWFCGDNPVCDIEGSAAAGMTPVWYTGALRYEYNRPACGHLKIDNWPHLAALLKDIKYGGKDAASSPYYVKD